MMEIRLLDWNEADIAFAIEMIAEAKDIMGNSTHYLAGSRDEIWGMRRSFKGANKKR